MFPLSSSLIVLVVILLFIISDASKANSVTSTSRVRGSSNVNGNVNVNNIRYRYSNENNPNYMERQGLRHARRATTAVTSTAAKQRRALPESSKFRAIGNFGESVLFPEDWFFLDDENNDVTAVNEDGYHPHHDHDHHPKNADKDSVFGNKNTPPHKEEENSDSDTTTGDNSSSGSSSSSSTSAGGSSSSTNNSDSDNENDSSSGDDSSDNENNGETPSGAETGGAASPPSTDTNVAPPTPPPGAPVSVSIPYYTSPPSSSPPVPLTPSSSTVNENENENENNTTPQQQQQQPSSDAAAPQAPFITGLIDSNSDKNSPDGETGTNTASSPGSSPTTTMVPLPSGGSSGNQSPAVAPVGVVDDIEDSGSVDNNGNSGEVGGDDGNTADSISNDAICLAVGSQQPITSLPDDIEAEATTTTTTTFFSIGIFVAYHADIASSDQIKYYLDDTNPTTALYIAGCEEEEEEIANADIVDVDTNASVRKIRVLQEQAASTSTSTPVITYAEVEPWANTGPCDDSSSESSANNNEDAVIDELLSSSSSLCQQKFASRIQIAIIIENSGDDDADEDGTTFSSSDEYLRNQIIKAFDAVLKPFVETQPGVIGVELDEIDKEEVDDDDLQLETDESNSEVDETSAQRRRIMIIACSVVGAGIVMCIFLVVLICIYRRRQKYMPMRVYSKNGSTRSRNKRVGHVPFEDEIGILHHDDDGDDTSDFNRNLNLDSTHNRIAQDKDLTIMVYPSGTCPSDEDTSEGDGDDDYDLDDVPPPPPPMEDSPCYFDGRSPAEELLAADDELYCLNHPSDERDQRLSPTLHVCSAATCQQCEERRQLGVLKHRNRNRSAQVQSIQSTEPATMPMYIHRTSNTVTTPRVERIPLSNMTDSQSKRNYILDDLVAL